MENINVNNCSTTRDMILSKRKVEIDRMIVEHKFQEIKSDLEGTKKYFQELRTRYLWEVDYNVMETYPSFFRPEIKNYLHLLALNNIQMKMTLINQQSHIYWEIY